MRFEIIVVAVLLHQYGETKTCCRQGEIYDANNLVCVSGKIDNGLNQDELWSCPNDAIKNGHCPSFLLQPPTDENIEPLCSNIAKHDGQHAHVMIFETDIRAQFTNVDNYCTAPTDKFIVQNRCKKQVVWFTGKLTMVLTKPTEEGRECGIKLRYCQASRSPMPIRRFPKCCGSGYIYNSNYNCIKSSYEYTPPFTNLHDENEMIRTESMDDEINLEPVRFASLDKVRIIIDHLVDYSVGGDNQLMYKNNVVQGHYCVEVMENISEGKTTYERIIVHEDVRKPAKLPASFDLTFLSLETIFMGITFLIHLLLPRFKNLPGRIILLYTSTYLVWDFIRIHLKLEATKTAFSCFLRIVALPYLKWSKCWWLFLFTFELLLRIKGIGVTSKNAERKRLILYCLIAWVFNALLVAVACLGEGIAFNDFRLVRDNAGCNFLNRALDPIITVYIIVIPCALSCILDTVILVVVTKTIQETTKGTNKDHDYQKRQQRKRYILIVRLYALGLTKIINAVVDISAIYLPDMELPRHVTLTVLGLIYAIAIFVIFCCKRSILRQICRAERRSSVTSSSTNAFYTRKSRLDASNLSTEKAPELMSFTENE